MSGRTSRGRARGLSPACPSKPSASADRLIGIEEAAALFGVSPKAARRLRERRVPPFSFAVPGLGRSVRYRLSTFLDWIEQHDTNPERHA